MRRTLVNSCCLRQNPAQVYAADGVPRPQPASRSQNRPSGWRWDEGLQGTAQSRLITALPGNPSRVRTASRSLLESSTWRLCTLASTEVMDCVSEVIISSTDSEVSAVLSPLLLFAGLHERYDDRCAASVWWIDAGAYRQLNSNDQRRHTRCFWDRGCLH